MLLELTIENFAIIESLNLEFDEGMTVISGETGAGKSITVDALGFILGGKSDANVVTYGKNQAVITATFDVSYTPNAKEWLIAHEIAIEDNLCIIRRVINKEGRSKNYINNHSMPLHALKSLGEFLIDIHGQHAHQSLVKDTQQRILIDQYAEISKELQEIGEISDELSKAQKTLTSLLENDSSNAQQREFLTFQLQEFKSINPKKNEWLDLTEEHKKESNKEAFQHGIQKSLTLLNDSNAINENLTKLVKELNTLAKLDDSFNNFAKMANDAEIICYEIAQDLSRLNNFDTDDHHLSMLENRMQQLNDLARKHRISPEELLNKKRELEEALDNESSSEEKIAELEEKIKNLQLKWQEKANVITQKRQSAITLLNQKITDAMQALSMEGGAFEAQMRSVDKFSKYGQESIEFFVRSNPGMPFYPLSKVASGGELARISLAISVILSMKSLFPTLIFDEVDTGVGGAVAEIIGKHLQDLSLTRQVICVTHLPQVASHGRNHFVVKKLKSTDKTETTIKLLNPEERVDEIARMLGGVKLTDATYEHAREMLKENGI